MDKKDECRLLHSVSTLQQKMMEKEKIYVPKTINTNQWNRIIELLDDVEREFMITQTLSKSLEMQSAIFSWAFHTAFLRDASVKDM